MFLSCVFQKDLYLIFTFTLPCSLSLFFFVDIPFIYEALLPGVIFTLFKPRPKWGEHIVTPLFVRTFVRYVRPSITNVNGFRSLSFEKSIVLDSYSHRYIIIKYRSSSILGKLPRLFAPFFQLNFCLINRSLSLENIIVLDSYLVHWYIIIKCRSSSILFKKNVYYFGSYGPFSVFFVLEKWFPFIIV